MESPPDGPIGYQSPGHVLDAQQRWRAYRKGYGGRPSAKTLGTIDPPRLSRIAGEQACEAEFRRQLMR